MDSFETALDLVRGALSAMEARGVQLHASPESLSELSAVMRAAGPVSVPKTEPPPAAAPAPRESRPALSAPVLPAVAAAPVPARRVVPILPFDPEPVTLPLPVPSGGSKAEQLAAMRDPVLACVKCPALAATRTHVVFGVGNPEAELMFVGEAPGADEDQQGEPFVGAAGQLLTKIIEAMSFTRNDIYIANVLKCRPHMPPNSSGNRKPTGGEMRTCLPYLEQQISIIQPRLIVALGATAMEGLLGEASPMGKLRGRWHDFRGIPVMATYHPAYLLRNQSLAEKRKVWEDMLLVLERLGRTITEKQRGYFLQKG